MDDLKMLSGYEIVELGNQKSNVKLPEVGLKEVFKNGSWLEQKQIQAALEARKDIVEVKRIEKCGILGQAIWNEELGLAEVTHKTGGHWQFLGHSKGDKLYLYPEEALFLMELNCLLLRHNDIIVSLQEAYTLLLRFSVTILQYKVYASLSRLGYKVLRHNRTEKHVKPTEYEKKINLPPLIAANWEESLPNKSDSNESQCKKQNGKLTESTCNNSAMDVEESNGETNCENKTSGEIILNGSKLEEEVEMQECCTDIGSKENIVSVDVKVEVENLNGMDVNPCMSKDSDEPEADANMYSINDCQLAHHNKIMQLRNRQLKLRKINQTFFDNIPDLYQKKTVTIQAPPEQFIPKNVYLNLTDYTLNMETINSKPNITTQERRQSTYSLADEVNGPHVKRIKSSDTETPTPGPQCFTSTTRYIPQFRPFNFFRPRQNINFYQLHFLFQRPFQQRYNIPPVPPLLFMRFQNTNNENARPPCQENERKRTREDPKLRHLKNIQVLVARLKKLFESGNNNEQNTAALKKLITSYNIRYNTKLRLTDSFDLIDDLIVDTIELDDDEQPQPKKFRQQNNFSDFTENLNALKRLAVQLKDLEEKRQTNHRHRRALINAIRTFNKSYNAEVFMNNNFEVLDLRHITLASTSDSDCVIEDVPKTNSGKKLKNPFNILKRLSEKRTSLPSQTETDSLHSTCNNTEYPAVLIKTFHKWLPNAKDFGRAEVVPKTQCNNDPLLLNGDYLLEYLISNPHKFENWRDLKLSFLESVNESIHAASKAFKSKPIADLSGISPIIKPEECTDIRTVLKKLSIIKNRELISETELRVNFDVYNRDVQNFKKSNRPKPHFMISCIDESSNFPPSDEIAALHSNYDDATLLFAIVGTGSVQYLQINPMVIPVYISKEAQ